MHKLLSDSWVSNIVKNIGVGQPINQLIKLQRRPMDFPFHVWGTRISPDLEPLIHESKERYVGCGISDDNTLAIAAACGEALERYAFAAINDALSELPSIDSQTVWSAEEISNLPFLLPTHQSRVEWSIQAEKSPIKFMVGWQLTDGKNLQPLSIPVEISTGESRVDLFQTSNGMSCSSDLDDAIERGIKEIVERDALMLVWLYRTAGVRLSPEDVLPSSYSVSIDRMQAQGIQTIIRDISTDFGYRVVLAIVGYFPDDALPVFAFGAGADLDLGRAAAHAFREACLGWRAASWRVGDINLSTEISKPTSFSEHAAMYFQPDEIKQVEFLWNDDASGSEQLVMMNRGLEDRQILILDLTTPDIRELGAHVVKVSISGLVPFYVGELRADELALARMPTNIAGKPINIDRAINLLPHPWP
jgi:ribosomal protein S12 methylthiotransferase accessory factor